MKFKIQAGAELDLITKQELGEVLTERMAAWRHEIAKGVRFRQFSARATVVGGNWTISPADADDNVLGPDPGMLWSVTNIAVSGNGLVAGTDLFAVHFDDITPSKLIAGRLVAGGGQQWNIGGLVLNGGSKLALAGVGTGTGTEVWLSGHCAEVPVQLAGQLL